MTWQIYRYNKSVPVNSALLDRLYAIEQQSFELHVGWGKATIGRDIADPHNELLLVMDEAKTIAGYGICQRNFANFYIICIAIGTPYRNQGLGTLLMQGVKTLAKEKPIIFHCRPLNEPFYNKLGFVTTGAPIANYYPAQRTCGLAMEFFPRRDTAPRPLRLLGPLKPPLDNKECKALTKDSAELDLLILLATQVKERTSFWYGSAWFAAYRSQRKELAFTTIINELLSIKNHNAVGNRALQPIHVLRAIVHNALIIRGSIAHSETTSGCATLNLLKQPVFAPLLQSINTSLGFANARVLSYDDLRNFAEITQANDMSESTPAPFSPYCHFAKM